MLTNDNTLFTLPDSEEITDVMVSENTLQTLSNKRFKDSNNVEYTIDDIPKLNKENTFTSAQTIASDTEFPFKATHSTLTTGSFTKLGITDGTQTALVGLGLGSSGYYAFYKLNGQAAQLSITPNTFQFSNGKIESTQTTANNALGENLKQAIFDLIYPVGSIYITMNKPSSSAVSVVNDKVRMTLYGCSFELLPSETFIMNIKYELSNNNTDYSVKIDSGNTGGEAKHTLTMNELPNISGGFSAADAGNFEGAWGVFKVNQFYGGAYAPGDGPFDYQVSLDIGKGYAHNNVPPYITCYIWKRIA